MKVLDLFAGIGGFSLAAHWMGWETVAFVEIDPFCQKVLKKNFPNTPVYGDIKKLDDLLFNQFNLKMNMSRPPHYVDNISGGLTSYDVYSQIGYQYLAASFDGAGWLPMKSYEEEVKATFLPLENALKNIPDALCGQIIFQKDGYNMALRTPVAGGLEKQLEILCRYGYQVITVNELLNYSQFTDVGLDDPDYKVFSKLLHSKAIAYSNNTLKPDSPMTRGELAVLLSDKEHTVDMRIESILKKAPPILKDIKPLHKYSGAIKYCLDNHFIRDYKGYFYPDKTVDKNDLMPLSPYFNSIETIANENYSRRSFYRNFII